MAKLGRPAKYDGSESRITIRLNKDQRDRVEHYAEIDQTTMNDIILKAVQQYINRRTAYLKRGVEMQK